MENNSDKLKPSTLREVLTDKQQQEQNERNKNIREFLFTRLEESYSSRGIFFSTEKEKEDPYYMSGSFLRIKGKKNPFIHTLRESIEELDVKEDRVKERKATTKKDILDERIVDVLAVDDDYKDALLNDIDDAKVKLKTSLLKTAKLNIGAELALDELKQELELSLDVKLNIEVVKLLDLIKDMTTLSFISDIGSNIELDPEYIDYMINFFIERKKLRLAKNPNSNAVMQQLERLINSTEE